MKDYAVENTRNVVIVSPGGAGKTTLTEAMLFAAGATDRMGRVEEGNTVTDFEPEEINRKSSISSAAAFCEWGGNKITLIDTPGYINFIEDAKACVRAADGAVVIMSPISGIKAETEKVWEYLSEFGLPRIIFVAKMDKERADIRTVLGECGKGFCREATPVQIPIGSESAFKGIIDLLKMKAYITEGDGKTKESDIPADMKAEADEFRGKMVEKIAESDDSLIEKYLETGELSQEEILSGLRKGCISGKVTPVLCGAPPKGIGVPQLLDMITAALPNPVEKAEIAPIKVKDAKGEEVVLNTDKNGPLAAVVFKTIADPFAGKLSLFRVISGQMRSDSAVFNATREKEERVGQVFYLMGKKQVPVQVIKAGEIAAVAKLKDTVTGDTLCDKAHPYIAEPIHYQ